MPFLVIGGHAICAHGLARQTGDIDLVVPKSAIGNWHELMGKLKYTAGQNDDRFARFRPESLGSWPIDLMFVDNLTFEKLAADAVEFDFGFAHASVVSARHLATMKIHALKQYQDHRFAKDYGDLVWLLRSGKTKLTEEDLRALCERYATAGLFDKLKSELGKL